MYKLCCLEFQFYPLKFNKYSIRRKYMSIWFEGSNEIKCTFKKVQDSFENYGEHYVKVIGYMLYARSDKC